jgi:hypothetical protein
MKSRPWDIGKILLAMVVVAERTVPPGSFGQDICGGLSMERCVAVRIWRLGTKDADLPAM